MPPACAVVTQVGGILRYWPGKHRSDKVFHDLGARFDADDPAVQRDMIVGGAALWSKKFPTDRQIRAIIRAKGPAPEAGLHKKWRT